MRWFSMDRFNIVTATNYCGRPSSLHVARSRRCQVWSRRCPVFGRALLRGGGVLVAVRLVLSGHAGVADISGAPVRLAVGISGGSAWSAWSAYWGGGAMHERRLSCCSLIGVVSCGRLVRSCSSLIGAVESGSLSRGGTTAIEIGLFVACSFTTDMMD
jgi:hypothetical protein